MRYVRVRQLLLGVLAVLLGTAGLVPVANAQGLAAVSIARNAVFQDSGLVVRADTVYTPLPTEGRVAVAVSLTMTNVTRDRTRGNYIEQYYYNRYGLPVPQDAVNVNVSSRGGSLRTTREELAEGYVDLISFGFSRLYSQQTRTLVVNYDLPSASGRSDNPTRANAAYVAFPVWAYGDPERASVRVDLPPLFVPDFIGSELEATYAFGAAVLQATDIEDPYSFYALVTAQNDGLLGEQKVTNGDAEFVVRSWPGDDEWTDFVVGHLGDGLDELEDAIGSSWPHEESHDLVEAYSPYLYGYAGWYDGESNEMVIGEDLDADVVLHELAHGWFNDDLFSSRWINEAFASTYAHEAARRLGIDGDEPTRPLVSQGFPLEDWERQWRLADDDGERRDQEEYGYNASEFLMLQIFEEIGAEAMSDVVQAAVDGDPAYGSTSSGPSVAADFYLLDLLEEVGGSEDAFELFEQYVANGRTDDKLVDRTEARLAVEEFAAVRDEWAVPDGILRNLELWQFDNVSPAVENATEVIDRYRSLADRAQASGLELEPSVRASFERNSSSTFLNSMTHLDDQEEGLDNVVAAAAAFDAERGLMTKVGLYRFDLDAELADVRAAFDADDMDLVAAESAEFEAFLADAEAIGERRTMVAAAILFGFVLLLVGLLSWRRRRKRNQPDDGPSAGPTPLVERPTYAFIGPQLPSSTAAASPAEPATVSL